MESFRRGLREQGYVNGRNVAIELRYSCEGAQHPSRPCCRACSDERGSKCTAGDLAPKVARQATRTIPIVAITDDMLGAGLVASLLEPGASITGLTILASELSAKRLEILKISRICEGVPSSEKGTSARPAGGKCILSDGQRMTLELASKASS